MSAKATSNYYPEENEPDLEADPESMVPANLGWMDRILAERAQEVKKEFKIVMLPPVRKESVINTSPRFEPLRAVPSIEELDSTEDEDYVLDLASQLKIACRKMRADWEDERIAPMRRQLGETASAIRLLIKRDTRRRRFNPLQPLLFKD